MPTTYAHWRFGEKCIETLPVRLKDVVRSNREIFDYGVHGPDIFFYYKCLKSNEVNKYGGDLHDRSYRLLLKQFKEGYLKADDKMSVLSYILGFTCHFTLDSYCHGYIERKDEESSVSHNKIESQFDRYLLVKDGYNPVKKSVTFSLKPNKKIAHDIHEVFPNFSEKVIYQTISDQKKYLNLLKDNNSLKRTVFGTGMDLMGIQSFKDLFLTNQVDPECMDSNERLDKLFNKAIEHYPVLVKYIIQYLNHGNELPEYFDNNFSYKKDYKNIPVLSLEEEHEYKIHEFQK